MPKTYRPRISRKQRDTVIETAEQLNGAEPNSYSDALTLLVRYLDVLNESIECPSCGETDIEQTAPGKYRCWQCDTQGESGYFDVWGVIEPANREQASLPGLPKDVHYRFECDHEEHTSGSKDQESAEHGQNPQGQLLNDHQDRWNDGF